MGNVALDNVGVKALKQKVEDSLVKIINEGYTLQPNDAATQARLADAIQGHLGDLKEKQAINDYSVTPPKEVYYGWRKLYPKLLDRIMAFCFYKVVGTYYYDKQRWFHTVFPFKITYSIGITDPYDYERDELATAVEDAEYIYYAVLGTPYTVLEMGLTLAPKEPVNFISLKCEIDGTGELFNGVKE